MFLTNHLLAFLRCPTWRPTAPPTSGSSARMFGMHAISWPDEPKSVEFHLAHGDWIRLLRANGFEVEDLVEVQAPDGATTTYDWMSPEWARKWPCEEAWKVRKAG